MHTAQLSVLHVKWEVMKRKDVPKKVKDTARAPLVLIWDTMRVVTVEDSTSVETVTGGMESVGDGVIFNNALHTGPYGVKNHI